VPDVGADTIWNDVPDEAAGFELALRARIAWLANQLDSWCDLEHDMTQSSGGGNWAVRIWTTASTRTTTSLPSCKKGSPDTGEPAHAEGAGQIELRERCQFSSR
jgi:hypothetical protein